MQTLQKSSEVKGGENYRENMGRTKARCCVTAQPQFLPVLLSRGWQNVWAWRARFAGSSALFWCFTMEIRPGRSRPASTVASIGSRENEEKRQERIGIELFACSNCDFRTLVDYIMGKSQICKFIPFRTPFSHIHVRDSTITAWLNRPDIGQAPNALALGAPKSSLSFFTEISLTRLWVR